MPRWSIASTCLVVGFLLAACSSSPNNNSSSTGGSGGSTGGSGGSTGGSGGSTGGTDAGPPPGLTAACPDPVQAAPAASWTEVFVGPSPGCSDTSPQAGSKAVPFCDPHLAVAALPANPPAILTFLDGVYRLDDFTDSNGKHGSIGLGGHSKGATAQQYLLVRAAPGAQPVIVGSHRITGSVWTSYSASPRIFRTPVDALQNDVDGLWRIVDGAAQHFDQADRFKHIMKTSSGVRSHADVSALDADGTWTKADDSGTGCGGANAGCFVYLRLDSASDDPDTSDFEASQYSGFGVSGADYMVVRGLTTRFTQNHGLFVEFGDSVLVEDNDFGHNANGNENAYSMFIQFSNDLEPNLTRTQADPIIVRNNKAYDSAYWGGTPNSRGLTFMTGGDAGDIWVCGNEIWDIPGPALGTKDGVSNLHAVGNSIHDSYHGIETSGPRQQSRSSGSGQGPIHPGGPWRLQQNIFERCGTAIHLTPDYDGHDYLPNDVLNNLFIDNHYAVSIPKTGGAHQIHNNIFLGGTTTNSSSGAPGGALLFDARQNPSTQVYADAFFAAGVSSTHNIFFQMDHPFIEHYDNSGAAYRADTFDEFMKLYSSAEAGSMNTDPMLDAANGYQPKPGSPALGAGDGSFYNKSSVNIGPYP